MVNFTETFGIPISIEEDSERSAPDLARSFALQFPRMIHWLSAQKEGQGIPQCLLSYSQNLIEV